MRVIMRLYRRHDLDLITLYKKTDFSLQKNLKAAIRAYMKGEPYTIAVPPVPPLKGQEFHFKYQISINFDEVKDQDIVYFLKNNIRDRYRNAFLRGVLRAAIAGTVVNACLKDDSFLEKQTLANEKTAENYTNIEDYLPTRVSRHKKKNTNSKKKDASKKTGTSNKEVKKKNAGNVKRNEGLNKQTSVEKNVSSEKDVNTEERDAFEKKDAFKRDDTVRSEKSFKEEADRKDTVNQNGINNQNKINTKEAAPFEDQPVKEGIQNQGDADRREDARSNNGYDAAGNDRNVENGSNVINGGNVINVDNVINESNVVNEGNAVNGGHDKEELDRRGDSSKNTTEPQSPPDDTFDLFGFIDGLQNQT